MDNFPIRILSEKTGVAPTTLRAWERRYGLLKPQRTPKGHRLYNANDVDAVNRIVNLPSRAMATSGDYRNYYESEGRRFSHTIDPETGKPIEHHLASVTVIADDSMTADALATGFTVMGYERANRLATRENIPAYFIIRTENGFESHQTPAFSSYITQ